MLKEILPSALFEGARGSGDPYLGQNLVESIQILLPKVQKMFLGV